MHFKTIIFAFSFVIAANGILGSPSPKMESKIEPVTTTLVTSLLTPVVTNLISGLFGGLFTPNDYHDTVIYGRPMRIKMCGDTCVQITDRGSGTTVVGTGNTVQEAIGEATQKMFHELLDKNLLSLHDLCLLNIKFPHPDTVNCPGVQIDTCDLAPVHTTTAPNCINKFGDSYCEKNSARCTDHYYQIMMMDYCYKTCTNGCQVNKPVNPCSVSRLF